MIIKDKIKRETLQSPFTKAAADIKKGKISIGCELHIDCVEELIEEGSKLSDLWGFNIYSDGSLDFVALINIRPAAGNRSMKIHNKEICEKIENIVRKLL